MLIPAVVYKDEIIQYSNKLRYSTQMMYYNGCVETGPMNIESESTEGRYQWAVVDDNNELVGYIGYAVDYFSGCVYGFGLISFKNNKRAMSAGVLRAIKHILSMHPHRVEWRCIGDNPALIGYKKIVDRIVKKNNFTDNVVVLHDTFKDAQGVYHDCCIFELLESRR